MVFRELAVIIIGIDNNMENCVDVIWLKLRNSVVVIVMLLWEVFGIKVRVCV